MGVDLRIVHTSKRLYIRCTAPSPVWHRERYRDQLASVFDLFSPVRKAPRTVDERKNRHFFIVNLIHQSIALNENLSDRWVCQFREESPSMAKGTQGISSFEHRVEKLGCRDRRLSGHVPQGFIKSGLSNGRPDYLRRAAISGEAPAQLVRGEPSYRP